MIRLYQRYTYWQEHRFKQIRECLMVEERINRIGVSGKKEHVI